MKKNILLFTLLVLHSICAKAQCPASITEPEGDGSYYLLPLSPGTCSATVTALGGVGTNILINGQNYQISAASCAASGANNLHLEFNGVNPVVLSAQPVTISLNGANCVYNTMGVLPIELLSFTGKKQNNINLLHWQTASESQNNGFSIERSSLNPSKGGKIEWQKIGFVAGNGTTNTRKEYSFEDNTTFSSPSGRSGGAVYYRLKQLDFDGRFEYSKIIAIDSKGEKVVSVFPNPSKGVFTITGIEDSEDETFTLINSIGQTLSINVQNNGQLDMSAFPSGVYYLRVASSGQMMKLVKE